VADEGMFGYFTTRLERHWDWQLVHSPFNFAAPYCWVLFPFFKTLRNSLTALWLAPALLGWGSLFFLPFLRGKVFIPSTVFVTGLWLAFGFWPLYLARFSHQAILMVFWECLVLALLSRCLEKPAGNSLPVPWISLALLTGLGFYTYLAWPMVAFMVLVVFLAGPPKSWGQRGLAALQFGGWTLLPALPLFISFARDYHSYLGHLWAFGSPQVWAERLRLPWAYFQALLWGHRGSFGYGPLWGGLLNPVQGSLLLVGLAHLISSPTQARNLWLLLSLAVFSSPAFLTNDFEMLRLTPLIPILAYLSALGTLRVVSILSLPKAVAGLAFLLVFSFALDAHHLFGVYPDYQKTHPAYYGMHKSPEFERAYRSLTDQALREGPGCVLLNTLPDPFDQTLSTAVFSFNVADNPRLDLGKARWVAVLANAHEEPYFRKLFPGGSWTWLSEDLGRQDGGLILEVVPLNERTRPQLDQWTKADGDLQELTRLVMETGVSPDQSRMLDVLDRAYVDFKGDPLLESRYWRLRALHLAAGGKNRESIEAYRQGIEKGLPLAHLYNEMGCLLFKEKDWAGAQKAFEKAASLKPDLTNAKINLQNLRSIRSEERTGIKN
jgi:hypothetical protein